MNTLKNKGNFYWGQPDPKVWLRVMKSHNELGDHMIIPEKALIQQIKNKFNKTF